MLSVFKYAKKMNLSLEEVLNYCHELGFDINDKNDLLEEDMIIKLDNIIELDTDNKDDFKIELAKQKKKMYKNKKRLTSNVTIADEDVILYKENMTVKEFAKALGVNPTEIIKKLFSLGVIVNINNNLNFETAEILSLDYNKKIKYEETTDISNFEKYEIIDEPHDLKPRPPIVTIMGHVDHGKTSLLDAIKKSKIVDKEAGGITQTIGAYQAKYNEQLITFIDTPGHEAFTAMRARGASVTDLVIIIVAADDGIMPQTKEAIDHAKVANLPIIVAINKMDKAEANADKVITELAEYGLIPDTWGGDVLYSKISALTGEGIDELLENILLVSQMQEYKANPNRYASGTVIESRLDKHMGTVVTLIVQNGTLRIGDPIVVGTCYGKVRTMKDEQNKEIIEASPSKPVYITGLTELPTAGDLFMAFETEKEAKWVAEERKRAYQEKATQNKETITLDDLFSKVKDGIEDINVIIKADLNGSVEALKSTLEKIDIEGTKIRVIRGGVGAITENDVLLAKTAKAIIIGFNVNPDNEIKAYAKENMVEIRLYNVIYKVVEEMEEAIKGTFAPIFEEKVIGKAEIRKLFKFSKVGIIGGSYVLEGNIKSSALARIIRDEKVIHTGKIKSLQRETETVKEVKKGLECGITIDDYNDLKVNDIIEVFEMVEVKK